MIIIGLDPHPATHTAFAIDANCAKPLAEITVENSEEGILKLMEWAKALEEEERHWAIEGASNPFCAPLVSSLLADEESIINIPPSLTSQYRSRRSKKKNDRIDARNTAMALLANLDDLPAHTPHPKQRLRVQVLTRTRSRLVGELKANRIALGQMVSEGYSEEARTILENLIGCLKEQLGRLGDTLEELVKEIMPEILKLRGVAVVLGATILAEVGDVGRFEKESKFSS